jgi:methylated-DNA-[protein]-cysteine S-methyltransferase
MFKKIIPATRFGSVGIIWSVPVARPKITTVLLSVPGASADDRASRLYPGAAIDTCEEIEQAAAAIGDFLEGTAISFSLDIVELDRCPAFQRSVLRAEHGIPRGRVSSYGLIANHVGRPGAARAVGHALATNPFPLIVPCHRAVRSTGRLGGYQGGIAMKRALLEMEGLRFDNGERVLCKGFYYEI